MHPRAKLTNAQATKKGVSAALQSNVVYLPQMRSLPLVGFSALQINADR
jgi:hypothetical protein